MNVAAMLAGIRHQESGSFEGNYRQLGNMMNGTRYYGAYQMPIDRWQDWAAIAGIQDADMRSEAAQDRVAAHIMSMFYNQYGSWELAAMAWYAGPAEAGKVLRRGYAGTDSIQNPKIRRYVEGVMARAEEAHGDEAIARRIPRYQLATSTPSKGWVHPVAGKSTYSNSFYVGRDNKTGIHGAIDVYAKTGTPIVAPVAGKITSTKTGKKGGYTVRMVGNDGVTYYFAHMDSQAVVNVGDTVRAGEHLGFVGDSGNARGTSPHLHFSMRRNGNLINPFSYLEQSGSVGVLDRSPAEPMEVASFRTGVSGQLNSWLQRMSDQVRASAIVEPPTEDDRKLEDKQTQRQEMV